MAYKYINPTDRGYKQVQLNRVVHNALFPRRRIRWCHRYEVYLSDSAVELHRFTSLLGKIVLVLMYPLNVLMSGLGNLKQVNKEYRALFNEKEAGAFSGDSVTAPEIVEVVRTRSDVV